VSASTSDKTVTVIKGTGSRQIKSSYKFDNVFTSFSTQEDVFEATLRPIIRDVLMGYESTVFAYGQTGTGKTHTMEGDLSETDQHGVIPRSVAAIFDALKKNPEYISSTVYCSLLEIYNEELSDLLGVDNGNNNSNNNNKWGGNASANSGTTTATTKLAIMEGENGPFCRGLSETKVTSASDLLTLMQIAHQQRQTGETDMNKESSRSHCIFTLRVEAKRQLVDGSILEVGGKLHCVDLAGSECAKSCGNAGRHQAARERERMNINRSLLTLGRVVKLLKQKSEQNGSSSINSIRIPYRDSKLTRILQESLGGRCKTCLIATISPSVTAIEESMSTLNYAQAANGIINKPVTTSQMTVGGGSSFAFDINNKSSMEGAAGASVEHWHEMECRLEYMQSQVEEAQQALARKHIQQQELMERAETAELGQQLAERNHEKATHEISVLERKVEVVTHQLEESEQSLRETRTILKATQQTEVLLTKEATSLLQVLKTTITDGDRMHQDLLQKRKEEMNRKTATNDYRTNQISLLNELLQNLGRIQEVQQKHSIKFGTAKKDHNLRELQFLKEHSAVVEQMKKDCVSEIEGLRQSTQNELLPVIQRLVSSSKEKLNGLSTLFNCGDERLKFNCQSVLSRLVENSNRISELETAYRSSSEIVLDIIANQLKASKEHLSMAAAEITAALEEAKANRQAQRGTLSKSIGDFRNRCHGSIDEMGSMSTSHTAALHKAVKEIEGGQESRSSILQSISNMDGYLTEKNGEYVKKLEEQCSILKQQHETLVKSRQNQQQMNKALVTKVMSGMQALIENEMQSVNQFQSETFDSFLTANEETKSYNDILHQTTSDAFEHLGSTNTQLKSDIQQNFDGQNYLGETLERESSTFDSDMSTVMEGLRNPLDAFVNKSKDSLQTSEKEDCTTTKSIIHKARTQIETATNKFASTIQKGAEKGMSNLQESTERGWEYVREEVIQTVRNDVHQIQDHQRQVWATARKDLVAIDKKFDHGEKTVREQVRKGLEFAASLEQCLDVGVNERLATSINQQQEHIEGSQWMETAQQLQDKILKSQITNSTDLVSSSSEQLEGLARDVHRVHEEPAEIPDRYVPVYSEGLSSTKNSQLIFRNAELRDDGQVEHSKENAPMMSMDVVSNVNINIDSEKSSCASNNNVAVLKVRSGVNSTPSSTNRMKNVRSNTNESPPLKRVAADNKTKTTISKGLRKRSKRAKVVHK